MGLKRTLRRVRRRVAVVAIGMRDPRTPWHVRALAAAVVAFAVSPVDLIPDFVPILGYLDDAILIPLGVLLVVRLMPRDVRRDAVRETCRRKTARQKQRTPRAFRVAGALAVAAVWVAVAVAVWSVISR